MKITFIENRYKTRFWSEIASELSSLGWQVSWIVQNHLFKPCLGDVHVIPYPKDNDLSDSASSVFLELMEKDRGAYYFKNGGRHYDYYNSKLSAILLDISPDLVIGESTLFHELLTISLCKKMDILYLNPSTCRYPLGRFCFYLYDTLEPYGSADEYFPDKNDIKLVKQVSERKLIPDYMRKSETLWSKIYKRLRLLFNSLTSLLGWLLGERFNTPNPIVKLRANFLVSKLKKQWDSESSFEVVDDINWDKCVVYPLQMQPESNIDVWGYPYNNQCKNLESLVNSVDSDWKILVKPNPKVKYELSNELFRLIRDTKNIIYLDHAVSMDSIFNKTKWFFTVTGTVGIESIFSGKNLITTPNSLLRGYPNVYILGANGISAAVSCVDAIDLSCYLRSTSFPGVISDPLIMPGCISRENIKLLTEAFLALNVTSVEGKIG